MSSYAVNLECQRSPGLGSPALACALLVPYTVATGFEPYPTAYFSNRIPGIVMLRGPQICDHIFLIPAP